MNDLVNRLVEKELDGKAKYFTAKSLYMRGMSVNEIQKQTGIAPKTLNRWRMGMHCHGDYTSWSEQRAKAIADNALEAALVNREKLTDIFSIGCELIKKSLEARAKQDDPLDIREAKMVTDIITSLDKMNRLETGKPTEIIEDMKPISLEELRDAISKDKFLAIEVEATPIENPGSQ